MRDYKAECAALRAELREAKSQLAYFQRQYEEHVAQDRERMERMRESLRMFLGLNP